jgi:uncharacterized protein (TIGR00290 family)
MNQQHGCICSWSGGKDSCLALYKALCAGFIPHQLHSMVIESPVRGLKEKIIRLQAEALGIPASITTTHWETYETDFIHTLQGSLPPYVSHCVFGDIDLEGHKVWDEKVCRILGLKPLLPLWQESRRALVQAFLREGFRAKLVVVNTDFLSVDFLGRELNAALVEEFDQWGIDVCGENGEYHTLVTDGPIFQHPVVVKSEGIHTEKKYAYLKLVV